MSGRWAGVYFEFDEARPIEAEFEQDGSRLVGSMTDARVEFDVPLVDALARSGWRAESLRYVEGVLRRKFPEMPEGEIRHVATLPARSTIRGRVAGRLVRFRKRYEGPTAVGVRVGDWSVLEARAAQPVRYRGELSEDEARLEGNWAIPAPGLAGWLGTSVASGRFELTRR
jgi:hypothetical protein